VISRRSILHFKTFSKVYGGYKHPIKYALINGLLVIDY